MSINTYFPVRLLGIGSAQIWKMPCANIVGARACFRYDFSTEITRPFNFLALVFRALEVSLWAWSESSTEKNVLIGLTHGFTMHK